MKVCLHFFLQQSQPCTTVIEGSCSVVVSVCIEFPVRMMSHYFLKRHSVRVNEREGGIHNNCATPFRLFSQPEWWHESLYWITCGMALWTWHWTMMPYDRFGAPASTARASYVNIMINQYGTGQSGWFDFVKFHKLSCLSKFLNC